MIDWKKEFQSMLGKFLVDGADQALVTAAGAMADEVVKRLKGKSAIRFAGLFFAQVAKRSNIDRKEAISHIPVL